MKFESPRGPIAIDPKTRDIIENIYVRRVASHGGTAKMPEIQTSSQWFAIRPKNDRTESDAYRMLRTN